MFQLSNPRAADPAGLRKGITVIEVLTAMVVALIGVFGVMILIPFAVRQAQSGLDLDNANRMARNGIANFEIGQYQSTARWTDQSLIGTPSISPIDPVTRDTLVRAETTLWAIDPLRVTSDDSFSCFAPELGSNVDVRAKQPLLRIPELNLNYVETSTIPAQLQPFDAGMARRMFRSSDDLVFEASSVWEDVNVNGIIETGETREFDELDPPQQIYDIDPTTGAVLRRQALGEMSWMAIVQPFGQVDAPTNMFRMFTLVFKDRSTFNLDPDDLDTNRKKMEVRRVQIANDTGPSAIPRVGFGGGTIQVNPAIESELGFTDARLGDWIMLVSGLEAAPGTNVYRKQIGFYRIAADPFTDGPSGSGSNFQYITLDGSDFNFDFGDPDPATGLMSTGTYAVLLVNFERNPDGTVGERLDEVINVYERTFRAEDASNWNR